MQIGIGGSDLGPRALYLALEGWAEVNKKSMMDALFISNVDPDDATAVAASIDPETTLFILVSKSGTTQETLTNQSFVLDIIGKTGPAGLDPAKHMIAVTSATSPLAKIRRVSRQLLYRRLHRRPLLLNKRCRVAQYSAWPSARTYLI